MSKGIEIIVVGTGISHIDIAMEKALHLRLPDAKITNVNEIKEEQNPFSNVQSFPITRIDLPKIETIFFNSGKSKRNQRREAERRYDKYNKKKRKFL